MVKVRFGTIPVPWTQTILERAGLNDRGLRAHERP